MLPLTLEGDTLGEKHKHFNQLVDDVIANRQTNLSKINYDDSDIHNLLKIHTASRIKNVDYIIEVLKCDDMLYISTVIKQSTWLITEQEHAHIVNPEYLHTQLFPHMLTKAINKLLLHIRLHLRDEKRVEEFYNYSKDTFGYDKAQNWLLNCSIPFIQNVIQNEGDISLKIYKRLCKRSVKFLTCRNKWNSLTKVLFLLKSNTEEYLNFLDSTKDFSLSELGPKYTDIIMKKYPERILNNFQKYVGVVDLSIVARYIKKEEIIDFIRKHIKINSIKSYFCNYTNIEHFIKNMPEEDRFEFVKQVYIDKVENKHVTNETTMYSTADDLPSLLSCPISTYEWYKHAPFDVALIELKKLIRAESSAAERCAILSVLITCARKNLQHAKTVLHYYYDNHRNEPFKFKIQFVNNVITKMCTHEFDSETWSILDKLFHSLEVYIESENDVQRCLQSIIVYKVLHNENIPDIIEAKIVYSSFENHHSKLNEGQKNQIFRYLITSISTKLKNKTIINESDFDNTLNLLNNVFDLLKYWKKDIKEYLFIREKILELIKIKKQNSWKKSLSSLYDISKSWRKHLFEESIMLCPSERVCLNALKHEPQLLQRYSEEVNALRTNDSVTLRQLLTKLRVYWPHSLAKQWTNAYVNNFDKSTGHKALITGLLVLLPQNQFIDLAKKYAPKDFKIEWNEINQMELNLSKNLAKCLHIARPLPSLDVILWYAKGDYLQYAVPSLSAILHNISKVQSCNQISNLLKAPVSLQKYGLRLAFIKLEYAELKTLFSDIWKTTNNLTIRTHLFKHTFTLLCTVKDLSLAKDLWQVLDMFISNLTSNENKEIYQKLGDVDKIYFHVRGEYFMKSYAFLTSLPASANCVNHKNKLVRYAPNIMDMLDSDFVADKIIAPINQKIAEPRCDEFIDLMSSYVLHGKTEEEQCKRFRRVLVPALEHALTLWHLVKKREYVMKNNVDALFKALTWQFRKYVTVKKIIVPVKLFSEIRTFIEQKMPIEENYIRYTSWKLITEYVKLVAEHNITCEARFDNILLSDINYNWLPENAEKVWEELHMKISPKLGPIIVKYLREDTEKYFPTICLMFSEALNITFSYLSFYSKLNKLETLKHMVLGEDFIPSYIVVCTVTPTYVADEEMEKLIEIRNLLSTHPSKEVQMHYQSTFAGIPNLML